MAETALHTGELYPGSMHVQIVEHLFQTPEQSMRRALPTRLCIALMSSTADTLPFRVALLVDRRKQEVAKVADVAKISPSDKRNVIWQAYRESGSRGCRGGME